jgi:hypothetical protein
MLQGLVFSICFLLSLLISSSWNDVRKPVVFRKSVSYILFLMNARLNYSPDQRSTYISVATYTILLMLRFSVFKSPFLGPIRNHFAAEYTPYEWPVHCEVAASEGKILHIAFSSWYGSSELVKYLD